MFQDNLEQLQGGCVGSPVVRWYRMYKGYLNVVIFFYFSQN